MITTLIPQIAAACTAGCIILYVATAKRNVPITPKDAEILWKLHKRNANCTSHKWHPLTQKHGKMTGFQCQCGYTYTQKRPLMSRMLKRQAHAATIASTGTLRRISYKT